MEKETMLLRDASRKLGDQAVRSFLPEPFKMFMSAHDTGCQIQIFLKSESTLKPTT